MVSITRSYCTPAQYLILTASGDVNDYVKPVILINNMTSRVITTSNVFFSLKPMENMAEILHHFFPSINGESYYFIGTPNYLGAKQTLVEGSWEEWISQPGEFLFAGGGMATGYMEEVRSALLDDAIEEGGLVPFIYTAYKIKENKKLPAIKETYGLPYDVWTVDFCSIESTTKRQAD